ncbi:UbiH/UbiF/VisC/COQ6 family ubiquinone biosynthesis hydroxylase [Thalassorhabdomicrobium marinisediminis]|uniref:2-octaprenyl-6-methoxyphenyl hydroxylase n=1 Tax=Thalassorhabdomicrobium marinisediminis TaxID=2170577 RepID=A0A2T7G089_9RHOB|nr:UbiH/UbiF/VisC/COQ6 family ubiquinone biosynthesis hydroxylase [Thalassorhabdomicrobium marinisediminis]PVA07831.1 2-octaprenyl-6-methoxyphenyl hydroxylase [Thalassorhabdomicrobium marinisediminis]
MDNPARQPILRSMTHDTDIAIVGGGLNGPALALALARIGLRVTVIDALPAPTRALSDFDGRSYALALASVRLLRGIGVWDAVAEHAQPMLEIKVTDGRAGEGAAPWMLHFDHAEIEEGPMGYMVEDRHLRRALMAAMDAEAWITQRSGERVEAQSAGSVTLASGDTISAALVVGADGRQSGTAQRAGITRTGWGYGQTAIVCAVEHALPHNGIAHQFFMPAGPLAILPITGNRSSIVWAETDARAAQIMALDDAEFLDALRPAFGSFLGEISVTGKRFSYPLTLTIADRFIAERVALVGDAAHGVHPIAGQGLNAGLRDVAALFDVLRDARQRGEDIGSPAVLARYEQWRRFDTTTLAIATDTFNKLFSNDNPLLRAVRDVGMGLVNAAPALRRSFIREAAGLTGDLPSLMKG